MGVAQAKMTMMTEVGIEMAELKAQRRPRASACLDILCLMSTFLDEKKASKGNSSLYCSQMRTVLLKQSTSADS